MSNILKDKEDPVLDQDLLKEKSPRFKLDKDAKSILTWFPWVAMIAMVVFTFWPFPRVSNVMKDLNEGNGIEINTPEVPALPLPGAEEELYIKEPATAQQINQATGHADLRQLMQQVEDLEKKMSAVVGAINTGTTGGGVSEDVINKLAREQVEYYKRREDRIAKSKGWRNYITWDEINP